MVEHKRVDSRKRLWDICRAPFACWLALLVLLGATCALAYVRLGNFNLPLSLAIAALKCGLVGAVFMRLSEARALNRLAACVGPIWIFILFLLAGADYFTR